MNKIILGLLLFGFSSVASAQSFHRCFFNMDYQVGLFSPLALDAIGKQLKGQSTENYQILSFAYVQDIPIEFLQPGGQLEGLLESKFVVVARILPNQDSVTALVLDKRSFKFLTENKDLRQFAILFDYMGGKWEVLLALMKHAKTDVLVGQMRDDQDLNGVTCSYDPRK